MAFSGNTRGFAMRRGWLGPAAFFASAVFAMLGCGPQTAGTEVADPEDQLAGVVQQENGAPAEGAAVIALSQSKALGKIAGGSMEETFDTVYTDSKGKYHFDSLPGGVHFLTAEEDTALKDGNRCWRDTIITRKGQISKVAPLQLRPPGELLATVLDEVDGTLLKGAQCKVDGTPYSAVTATGVIHFYLPEGNYRVVCHVDGYANSSIYAQIIPRTTKEIPITLGQGGNDVPQPAPDTVNAAYDSVSGVVTLTWSRKEPPQFVMYGIRRVDEALGGPPQQFVSTDTVWRDNPYAATDTVSRKVLRYSVYCLKKDLLYKTGTPYIRVTATRPTAHGADLGLRFAKAESPFKVGDTAYVVGSFRNAFRNNVLLQWKIKGSQDSVRQLDLSGREGEDILAFPCLAPGQMEIGFTVTDVAGFASTVYKPLEILPGP